MRSAAESILRYVVPLVYGRRWLTLGLLFAVTLWMAFAASRLQPDPGFEKQIPLTHPYMQVFKQYEQAFGGANLISIALLRRPAADGSTPDLYDAAFLDALRRLSDEIFFLPGVDRARVTSLFTPGVRYLEVVEDGFHTGDVIPRDYRPTPAMFAQIRDNVGKAGLIGRLVAEHQDGALVVAELLEHHPSTGEKLDYRDLADKLEAIRARYDNAQFSVHIAGFAKVVGDVDAAGREVASFFGIAIVATLLLLWAFCGSLRLALLPLCAALTAVTWELGLLQLCGYGLDPFAILVPFLILAIGVSHGVQYINAWSYEVAFENRDACEASIASFRQLFIPGTVAILTNVVGFATLAFIQIGIVQEMAINAALGMAAVIITNKVMLPIVLSWVRLPDPAGFRARQQRRAALWEGLWSRLAAFASPRAALPALALAALALGWALWMYPKLIVGDRQAGVPELRPDSRYNLDSQAIVNNFAIGVDVLKVLAEVGPYGCVDAHKMAEVDRLAWHLRNTEGVQSVLALPQLAKEVRSGWFEAAPKWKVLPQAQDLGQMVAHVPGSLGLANPDCSVLPIVVFLADHRAETIARAIGTVQHFDNRDSDVRFLLASGNAGVWAATNEEIRARELLVIIWVHATLALFAWLSFRSAVAVLCIVGPLVLCSLLTYGLMATLGIGMKPATLPVAAFGVGIGVDYGIYLWSVLARRRDAGLALRPAYADALRHTGKAVIFTSASLLLSVFTWLWSDLQFQADMGLLLLFMFGANLFGAILLLPALAWLATGRGDR